MGEDEVLAPCLADEARGRATAVAYLLFMGPAEQDKEWQEAIPKLEKAKGIIFDMRGYPVTDGVQRATRERALT